MPKDQTELAELEREFQKGFERDCYALECEAYDCCECSVYQCALEQFIDERKSHYLLITKSELDQYAEARYFDCYEEAEQKKWEFQSSCEERHCAVIACVIFQVKR